jgi:hypothetical protein
MPRGRIATLARRYPRLRVFSLGALDLTFRQTGVLSDSPQKSANPPAAKSAKASGKLLGRDEAWSHQEVGRNLPPQADGADHLHGDVPSAVEHF